MHPFPRLRWVAPAWLAVYVPSYAIAYGWTNFLFLCNVGVVVGAIGLWRGSRLWLSTGGVASIAIGAVWAVDFFGRLALGEHPLGVTGYMWDPQYPLFTRALSLYHVAWPALTVVCLRRIGYDPRAWRVQALVAVPIIVAGRFAAGPVENINYAWTDPLWGVELGAPAVHLATIAAATVFGLYGLSHRALDLLAGDAASVAEPADVGAAEPA